VPDSPPQADADRELLTTLLLEKYEPIAVIGMGLRFPGADTPDELAESLRAGVAATGPIPDSRWDVAAYQSDTTQPGRISTHGGGFLRDIAGFDPQFFNISPREARYIDPQQRLVLETAWEALEHAGIDPHRLRGGSGGVYIGAGCHDYGVEARRLPMDELDGHIGTGTSHSAVSGRLSFFLGWRGPCLTVDTACSSSLVALHLATEGLRRRECEIALAGGVSLVHHPYNHVVFSQAGMLSPDGRCKTFDDSADGYGRSEGCGIVTLKRMSDARRDGDRILGLIRGVAVRQDGESGGLTVPNGTAQEGVMRAALAASGLGPADIAYVEAHGTGTPLGDPIEIGAIRSVFQASHSPQRPVIVASFKTNVGHMESAAGIGGAIKTLLQFAEPDVYPHLNLTTPSRHIRWEDTPVTVPTAAVPWPRGPRRALVNSFGFAGTIASMVLEQPPPAPPATEAAVDGGTVFTMSARTRTALRRQAERMRTHLDRHPDDTVADICRTAALGRAHLSVRLAGVVRDRADLDRLIDEAIAADPAASPPEPIGPVAFLFTGQGAQYPGMGAALYRRHRAFQSHVDACDRLFRPLIGRSVAELITDPHVEAADLAETRYTQPALFTLEYALAQLWISYGIRPTVLLGHSIGEIAAAAVAGVLDLPDAVRLVAARGRLMQSVTAPGGMVAVAAPAAEVEPLVAGHPDLALAAVNAPLACVVSGGVASLGEVEAQCRARDWSVHRLDVSHAFHSPLMTEVYAAFRDELNGIVFHEPQIAVVSDVTGEIARPDEVMNPDYWVRQIGAPVRFLAGMQAVAVRGRHTFIEIGPGDTLLGLGRRCLPDGGHTFRPSIDKTDVDGDALFATVAAVYAAGAPVSWPDVWRDRPGRRLPLPTYAFDRRHYWLPGDSGPRLTADVTVATGTGAAVHPLLGTDASDPADPDVREFRARFDARQPDYLADHVVAGQVMFPAAGFLEILLAAQEAAYGEITRPLHDFHIHEPLLLDPDEPADLRTRLVAEPDGTVTVTITGLVGGAGGTTVERCHATARFGADATLPPEPIDPGGTVRSTRTAEDVYADFADLGLPYGPSFRLLDRVEVREPGHAVGYLRRGVPGPLDVVSAPLLDCALQSVTGLIDPDRAHLPITIAEVRMFRKPRGDRMRCVVRRADVPAADGELIVDADLYDDRTGRAVLRVRGLTLRQMERSRASGRSLYHEPHWTKRSSTRPGSGSGRHVLLIGATPEAVAEFRAEACADGLTVTAPERADTFGWDDRYTDVCWFWRPTDGPVNASGLRTETEERYRDLLGLLADLERHVSSRSRRLWLVTAGAQRIPGDPADDGTALAAATLWGFGHTIWTENPGYRTTLVDLPPDGGWTDLCREIVADDATEFQIAYRSGVRHVRRIRPVRPGTEEPERQLTIRQPGEFSGLAVVAAEPVAPLGDEIEVLVRAAGLNFKDVLNALGLLAQHARDTGQEYRPLPLGLECAGTVIARGPDATFEVGDDVIVCHIGTMSRRLTVSSRSAVRKPATVPFAEAAGVPTAFTSAQYALHTLAGLKAGDTVLIHAAAGGVGQAAIQLARLAGAEIYATASPRKWPLLRSQGITHLMNSRTLDFADEIMAATAGRGVDVVLNSLNKDFIPAGMRVVASGGHFVELGKIGVLTPAAAAAMRPDVHYHNFDLGELPPEQMAPLVHTSLSSIVDLLDSGRIAPPPTTVYELDEAAEAFGVLSRGANVGKIAISFDPPHRPAARPVTITADETYLITGWRGALGLAAAEHLVRQGARHLALIGRASTSEDRIRAAEQLGDAVELLFLDGDVGDPDDVARMFAAIDAGPHPLAGILHIAGVLADAPLTKQSWDRVETTFNPKVYGGWNLHLAARDRPDLKFFAAYSSITGLVGPAAQANYAAANAYLDALMQWRAALGLPALALDFGPWGRIGMAANLGPAQVRSIEEQGLSFLRPATGLRALATALDQPWAQVVVGDIDWDRYAASRPAANALYEGLSTVQRVAVPQMNLADLTVLPASARLVEIERAVRIATARVLHIDDPDEIATDVSFASLGTDSLVAVELKNVLEKMFGLPLPAGVVFNHPTVALLAANLDELVAPTPATADLVTAGGAR
jgi:acyl transferase domain-containing protein/NADPH-dependent curcumin reductase CurA/acyl carrier protein